MVPYSGEEPQSMLLYNLLIPQGPEGPVHIDKDVRPAKRSSKGWIPSWFLLALEILLYPAGAALLSTFQSLSTMLEETMISSELTASNSSKPALDIWLPCSGNLAFRMFRIYDNWSILATVVSIVLHCFHFRIQPTLSRQTNFYWSTRGFLHYGIRVIPNCTYAS